MAAQITGPVPPYAHIPVMVTYMDRRGHQLPLPPAQMRESFTGLQLLGGHVLGDVGQALAGYEQDFTIMQMGPSAFEIEIRASVPRQNRLRGRAAVKHHMMLVGMLDHFTDVLISLGEVACYLANHPDTEVRFVQGPYGPYYELLQDGHAAKAIEAPLLEQMVTPEALETLRILLANQKQPGVCYATLSKQVPGVNHMRRTVVPATQPLRDFANGGPLTVDARALAEARERVDEERMQQWVTAPTTSDSFAAWAQL